MLTINVLFALLGSVAVPGVVTVIDKISNENTGKRTEALIPNEPIHYHILPPNDLHPCDKYGCQREAKYQFGDDCYCDDKAISHFREIVKTCQEEGFELIEDLQQLEI
jgi:hypothetical protein